MDINFVMFKCYYSPEKGSKCYVQSVGFIRNSPERFRNTIVCGEFPEKPAISRLRNSFSTSQIKYFDQFSPQIQTSKQERKRTYDNLKATLDQLQSRLRRAKFSLASKNFSKKKSEEMHQEEVYDKNRETISTQATNRHFAPMMKISQYITSQPKPSNFHSLLSNPYDSQNFNLYYISQVLRAANQKNSLAIQHINASIRMIQSCSEYYNQEFDVRAVFQMKRRYKDIGKKTLVLDLDQTLIHCNQNLDVQTHIKLTMTIQDTKVQVGINVRPYAMTFLRRMAKLFQIVIFTASHQDYANCILDELDPQNQIFSHRFYRHHCTVLPNELHVKDLRHLSRDLRDVVLVDNAAYSYSFQLDNGIPILPYYEGKDFQLSALEHYLSRLLQVHDVRDLNRQYFKLSQYQSFQNAQGVIKSLCSSTHHGRDL